MPIKIVSGTMIKIKSAAIKVRFLCCLSSVFTKISTPIFLCGKKQKSASAISIKLIICKLTESSHSIFEKPKMSTSAKRKTDVSINKSENMLPKTIFAGVGLLIFLSFCVWLSSFK